MSSRPQGLLSPGRQASPNPCPLVPPAGVDPEAARRQRQLRGSEIEDARIYCHISS